MERQHLTLHKYMTVLWYTKKPLLSASSLCLFLIVLFLPPLSKLWLLYATAQHKPNSLKPYKIKSFYLDAKYFKSAWNRFGITWI